MKTEPRTRPTDDSATRDGDAAGPRLAADQLSPALLQSGPSSASARLRDHLAEPFSRNAYALILNTGVTGALGVVFWFLAARYYSDADVGRGSALISAMTLLASIVGINLTGTLSHFLPRAGRARKRFVLTTYGLSSVAVLVLALGFVAVVGTRSRSYTLLQEPSMLVLFPLLAVAACVFTLQDGVLVGMRGALWVPLENLVFGAAKIVLLVVLAGSVPREGVYFSWVIPMVVLLIPVSGLIFGRLIPRHRQHDAGAPPARRDVVRFMSADYVGALFGFGSMYLVPVVVAVFVAPDTFAHFYIAWTLGGLLCLVAINLAQSLTVEGGYDSRTIVTNTRVALRRSWGILLVAAVVVGLAGPYSLGVLGPGYVSAAPLLSMLAFVAMARAVVEIWVGVLRARGHTREIARVQIASGGLVVGAAVAWLVIDHVSPIPGIAPITGVGLAVLVSQGLVALAVLPRLWRFAALSSPARPSDTPSPDTTGGRVTTRTVETSTQRALPAAPARADPQQREPAQSALSARAVPAALGAATVAAVALLLLPLREVDLDGLTGLGLLAVLPVASLVGLALLLVAFCASLALRRPRRVLMGVQLVLLTVSLHGLPAIVEPLPRFITTWQHIGFVEYILRTGAATPQIDARFSWPGFFALAGMWTGEGDASALVRLTPWAMVASNLLYLLVFALLLRNVRTSWQTKWLAAALFLLFNWVGQDYFSPQGFTYLLYLIFIAILLTWFRPAASSVGGSGAAEDQRWRLPTWLLSVGDAVPRPGWLSYLRRRWHALRITSRTTPGEEPPLPLPRGMRTGLILLLMAVVVATTASHQLTPFVMLVACLGLVAVGRCTLRGLPVLIGVVAVAWISYMGMIYWSGHGGELLSGVGDLLGNVTNGVGNRTERANPVRALVVRARLLLAGLLVILAVLGALRRRRRGLDDRVLIVLTVVPLAAVALQSYGGEVGLRAYFFALAPACVLAASSVFPEGRPRLQPGRRVVVVALFLVVLSGAFLVARFGNERYEVVRADDVSATTYIYQHDRPTPARVFFPADPDDTKSAQFIPFGVRDVERVNATPIHVQPDPRAVTDVVAEMRRKGSYLVTTTRQEAFLEDSFGYPSDWGTRFRAAMAADPDVETVLRLGDAVVYAPKDMGTHAADIPAPGTPIGRTPWTGIGLVFVVLLVAVLLARELVGAGSAWRDHHRRVLTLSSVPLLVGFAAVVVERAVWLSRGWGGP